MKKIIQFVCKNIGSGKHFVKAAILAMMLGAGMTQSVTAQNCNVWADNDIRPFISNWCAPLQYDVSMVRTVSNTVAESNLVLGWRWGDGTPNTEYDVTTEIAAGRMTKTAVGSSYRYTLTNPVSVQHIYQASNDKCLYKMQPYIYFKDTKTYCYSTDYYNITVWSRDDEGMGRLVFENGNTNENVYRVCAGSPIDVYFWDRTHLACNTEHPDPLDEYHLNSDWRDTRFTYGIATSNIPELRLNGTYISTPAGTTTVVQDAIVRWDPNPRNTDFNHPTGHITVEAGKTTAGQRFTLQLENWNICGAAAPITASILVVPAPPKPVAQKLEFCHTNHYSTRPNYTMTVTHEGSLSGFTPGTYRWYADNNGSKSNILLASKYYSGSGTANQFNPTSTSDIDAANATYRMDPTKPGTYTYWVTYQFEDRTTGTQMPVCETEPVKMTWTVRSDISAKPGRPQIGPKVACAGDLIELRYSSLPANGQVGGQTQYWWEVISGSATLTRDNTNRGQSAAIQLTGDPTAPATETVRIRVHRAWVNPLNTAPTTGTCKYQWPLNGGCNYCPGDTSIITITVNPLPWATLSGGGEICAADDSIPLNLTNLRGKINPDNTSLGYNKTKLQIELTNGETRIFEYTGNTGTATIYAKPAPGTVTDYGITRVTDMTTGCVSAPGAKVSGSPRVIKRAVLNTPLLSFTSEPPGSPDLCPGINATWTASALPGGGTVTFLPASANVSRDVVYRWTWAGTTVTPDDATNPRTFNTGSATAPNGTVKNMVISYRYKDEAPNSRLSDKNCPETLSEPYTIIPAATVTLPPAQTVCNDDKDVLVYLNLTGLANSNWTVAWHLEKTGLGTVYTPPSPLNVTGNSDGKVDNFLVTIPASYFDATIANRPGTYRFVVESVTQTRGNCIQTLNTGVNITIRQTPGVSIPTLPQIICENVESDPITVNFTGNAGGTFSITYSSNKPLTSAITVTGLVSGSTFRVPADMINTGTAPTTITTITIQSVTQTISGLPCTATVSVPYQITTIHPPSANGPYQACSDIINLHAEPDPSGTNSYYWEEASPQTGRIQFSNINNPDATVRIINPVDFGVYKIRWVVPGGEACADETTVTFGTSPNPSLILAEPAYCGLTAPLTGTARRANGTTGIEPWETGQWALLNVPPGGAVISPTFPNTSPNINVEVSIPGDYTFEWTVTSGNCPGAVPAVKTITFNQKPDTYVQQIDPDPACQGETVTIDFADHNSLTGVYYSWSFNGGATNTITPPDNQVSVKAPSHTATTDQPFSGSVKGTSYPANITGGCPGPLVTFNVNVKPKPKLTPITDKTLCPKDSFELSLTPGLSGNPVTYRWMGVDATGNTPSPHPNSGMTDGSDVVNVDPYKFYLKAGPNNTAPQNGRLKVTAEVRGCKSDSVMFNVRVNPSPDIIVPKPGDAIYCSNVTVQQRSTTAPLIEFGSTIPTATVTWKYQGNNIGLTPIGSSQPAQQIPATSPPIYTTKDFITADNTDANDRRGEVIVTAVASGCTATDTFTITVRPRPRILPASIPSQSVCPLPTGPATLNNIVPKPAVSYAYPPYTVGYSYTPSTNFSTVFPAASIGSGGVTNIVNPDNATGSNITATMAVTPLLIDSLNKTNVFCIGNPETVVLTIYPAPAVNPIPDQARCPSQDFDAVNFGSNVAASNIDRYVWDFSGGDIGMTGSGTGSIPGFPAVTNVTGKDSVATISVYAVSKQGPAGCRSKNSETYRYIVYPSPLIDQVAANPPIFCPGETVQETKFSSNMLKSGTTVSYTWSVDNQNVAAGNMLSPGTVADTSAMRKFVGATNFDGSARSATVTVTGRSSDISPLTGIGCPAANTMTFPLTLKPAPRMDVILPKEYCPEVTINGGIGLSTNVPGSDITWKLDNPDISVGRSLANPPGSANPGSGVGNIPQFITANTKVPGNEIGHFEATATANQCLGDTLKFTLTVKPAPDIVVPVDTFYCAGENTGDVKFKSSFTGITYVWNRSGDNIGLSNTTGQNIIPSFTTVNNSSNMLEARESVFTVNSTLNSCASKPAIFTMTVMPEPKLDTYSALTACAGDTVKPPVFVPKSPDTRYNFDYTFSWASTTTFKEMQLVPLTLPAAANRFPAAGSGNLPEFIGDTTKTSYAAVGGNDLWGTTAKTVNIAVTPRVTYTYPATTPYAGAVKGCAGVVSRDPIITIKPLPVTTFSPSTDKCVEAGKRVIYQMSPNAAVGSSYVWGVESVTPGDPTAPSILNPTSLSYQVYEYLTPGEWKGWITAKETNNFGCSAPPAKLYIETVPSPIVILATPYSACSGDTLQLSATVNGMTSFPVPNTTGITLDWIGDIVPGEGQMINPHVVPYNTGSAPTISKVSLRAEKSGCVSSFKNADIVVYPIPGRPLLSGQDYCSNEADWKMEIAPGSVLPSNGTNWYRIDGSSTLPIGNSDNLTSISTNLESPPGTLYYTDALPDLPANLVYGADDRVTFIYHVTQSQTYTYNGISRTCASAPTAAQMVIRKTPDALTPVDEKYCLVPGQLSYQMSQVGNNVRWYYPNSSTSLGVVSNTYWAPQSAPGTYTYYVSQVGANGCETTPAEKDLVIHSLPVVKFNVVDSATNLPTTGGCSPLTIRATNNSPLPDSDVDYTWTWNWANSTTLPDTVAPQGVTVNHKYSTLRTIPEANTLMLTAVSKINFDDVSKLGCRRDSTMLLTIYPGVVANFVSDTAGCAPLIATFNNTSQYASRFRWYWDELSSTTPPADNAPGYGDIAPNVVHQFTNTSATTRRYYNVWLQVDNGMCYDNKGAVITVYPMPGVDFTHDRISTNSICPPDSVMFTNTSPNYDPGRTRYIWSYGDGALDTTNVVPPSSIYHQYVNITGMPIDRNVVLTASNQYGARICSNSKDMWITINPQVIAAFTPDTAVCSSPFTRTQFFSQSTGANLFTWNWGDGSAPGTGPMPFHVFENPRHDQPLVRTITLTASNYWCSNSVSHPFKVNPQPAVYFEPSPIQGCQPLPVTFRNTSNTYDLVNGGNPLTGMTYTYDFNDASSAILNTTRDTTHTYTNLGGVDATVYPKLTARNQWGCVNTYTHTGITIYPYVRADFKIVGDSIGCAPLKTTFVNGSRGYSSFVWDFGDGGLNSGTSSPIHEFANASYYADSIYYVRLTVTSGNNCSDTQTQRVIVHGQPRADFLPAPPYPADYAYPAPPIGITNTIRTPDKHFLTYVWNVTKQGTTSSRNFSFLEDPVPLVIPQTSDGWGKFDITQNVSSPNNYCSDRKTLTINIVPPAARARFDAVPPACMPYDVQFNNTSQFAKFYLWSFGDGATSNVENPKHTYADPGTYTVTLTATGDSDYPSVAEHTIVVHPKPQAAFEVQPKFLWVGQPVRAFNYTSHETSAGQNYDIWYRWNWGDNTPVDTVENPSHMYLKAGNFDITLTVGTNTDPQCITSLTMPNAIQMENAGDIILPNTFKPRPDGEPGDRINPSGYQNFLFYPPVLSPTRKYHFSIYNRWGQLLFETNDREVGWNGYFKGRICDEGVYIYKIEGVFETGQSFSKMGDVLLLR